MKRVSDVLRSYRSLSRHCGRPSFIRTISMSWGSGDSSNDKRTGDIYESIDDFEKRIFSRYSGSNSETDSFFRKLDRIERARGNVGGDSGFKANAGSSYQFVDGLEESFDTLSDGMDGKLKKAATYFAYGDEIANDDYKFRPDVSFPSGRDMPGQTYTIKDLDLTKPGIQKDIKRKEFETTTAEVLEKADFRNVRFLANFITAAGIIKKRKMVDAVANSLYVTNYMFSFYDVLDFVSLLQTGISAKAQRKVAREIKTARAFGLTPFTTMGQRPFKFGLSMEDTYDDFDFGPVRRRSGFSLEPEPEPEPEPDDLVESYIDPKLDELP